MPPDIPQVAVQQLREVVQLRPQTPQCEGTRVNRYLSDQGRPPGRCKHSSSYVIQGRALCKWHAGDFALQLLLQHSADKAAAATPPPPTP